MTTRIKCETVYTWRNTKTGEVFKEEKEGPDIVKDCTVKVDPKGLEIIQRVMNQKNDKPKS
jgi:hypothetical protein|tara:strand:- start:719 stop:901 length:183 start_codon:yes stop_codon:yes gene_type:complete